MRPVLKSPWPQLNGRPKVYKPHTFAKPDLELDIDNYCSYCEVFSSDLEVEHVISQDQDQSLTNDWDNFLLACGRCNGRDNKSNKVVNHSTLHLPHINNTMLSFNYLEGGYVIINPSLNGDSKLHAENMLNLVCLDKIPGNAKYPNLNLNDTRWKHRRIAWEYAKKYLIKFQQGRLSANDIVDFALQRGFFSVWFTVFDNYNDVKELLITRFVGTDKGCFDYANNFSLLSRNPLNTHDPV